MTPVPTCRILVLGESNSGKTALLECFSQRTFTPEHFETPGSVYYPFEEGKLECWEIGGAPRYAPLVTHYLPKAQFVLYCIDLTQALDLNALREKFQELKTLQPSLKIACVATKVDEADLEKKTNFTALAKSLAADFCFQTSALADINVHQIFEVLMKAHTSSNKAKAYKERFYESLSLLNVKEKEYKAYPENKGYYFKRYQTTETLHKNLQEAGQAFFQQHSLRKKAFQEQCLSALSKAQPIFAEHYFLPKFFARWKPTETLQIIDKIEKNVLS